MMVNPLALQDAQSSVLGAVYLVLDRLKCVRLSEEYSPGSAAQPQVRLRFSVEASKSAEVQQALADATAGQVHYAYFFSWRAAVMCCALHVTKHLATRMARRGGKRLQQVTKSSHPVTKSQPLCKGTITVHQVHLPGGPADPGSNPGSGSGSDEAKTGSGSGAAVLAGVQQAALRDTGSMLAGVLGQTNPTASSLPSLQSNSAAAQVVGALTGLPVAPPAA
ncbi:hypothetical protein HaLaN_06005 [Haematococcus lacustris]|uniref:Uncharacterized protein n=1 Tax=Haematococcus lacustris TaxID=44745 RepID=A0A699YV23_HAELA|nr:hypothetical protein HaLaN_06005 [Haematococcus lacustris]